MEVPVINRISDFETGLNSLQNPSFVSKVLSLSGIEMVSQAYSFCKWGALIFAVLASFSAIINRIKVLIIKFQKESSLSTQPFLQHFDFSDDDDDDDEDDVSSCSSSDYDSQEDIDSLYERYTRKTEDVFRVKGSGVHPPEDIWSSSLWSIGDQLSEIASGKSVVKLWDNLSLGLGLGFDEDCFSPSSHGGCASSSSDDVDAARNIFGRIPTVSPSSPAVVVAAGLNSMKNAAVRVWDTRLACRKPAILAEWRPKMEKADGVKIDDVKSGGVRKVILKTGEELTVGDMRKMSLPLGNVTGSDVETWWDANAVTVGDELENESKTKWL